VTVAAARRTNGGIAYRVIDLLDPWKATAPSVPVVLQHGLGLDGRAWNPWLRALVSERPVVTVDLRGHGGSADAWGAGGHTLERFANDILEVTADVGIDRFHLVGESLGGTVSAVLALGLDAPQVVSLTTCSTAWRGSWVNNVDTWPEVLGRPDGRELWSLALAEARFDPADVPADLWDWVVETQRRTDPRAVLGGLEALLRVDLLAGEPGTTRIPVLNLLGQSPFVDPKNVEVLAHRRPDVRTVRLPGARHGIVLSHVQDCIGALVLHLAAAEAGTGLTT
jgi:3-oxoadipate enol-lactonase